MKPQIKPVAPRFWSKVQKSPTCWNWIGAISCGYGHFNVNGIIYRSHRVAWMLAYGEIPPGLHVCHHCDNPPCVRPDHLFLGTMRDNIKDASRKGRIARGEKQGSAKLDSEQVLEIRRTSTNPVGRSDVIFAAKFGVEVHAIAKARKGFSWKHII
jgi:hypothetical protein